MNVPKLRFKEFTGEWEELPAKEIFENISEKNFPNETVLTIIQGFGTVPRSESGRDISFDKSSTNNYKRVLKNDFIIHLRSFEAGLEIANSSGIVSPAYTILRSKKDIGVSFYRNYFRSNKFINQTLCFAVEGVRDGRQIRFEQFRNIPLIHTRLEEQKKISAFLDIVDEKIKNQKAIVESLEKQKKALMQKVFSQELRFKDEDGNDFPAWEEKKLGEVGEITTGKTPDTNNEAYWNGTIQFITPMDMDGSKYLRTTARSVTGKVKYATLNVGTVMVTCIGATIGKMAITTSDAITNQQINSFYSVTENNEFVYYALLNIVPQIRNLKSSSTMPILNKSEFSALKIEFPCVNEQNKIAGILSLFDKKIEKEKSSLEHWQQIKKGLLQQMFV